MGQASRLRLALQARSRAVRDLLMTRRRGSSGRMEMPTTSGEVVQVVPLCYWTSAVMRVGRPGRESMRDNCCLSGWMMRPARREHPRQSVAMAATSVKEGVMKRWSSLYVRWVAGRDTEWPGMSSGRVMEELGRMALVITRLGAW